MHLFKPQYLSLVAVLAVGCGVAPYERKFTTRCGMHFAGDWNGYTPTIVQAYEDKAIEGFELFVTGDDRFKEACKRLKDWSIVVYPAETWKGPNGKMRAGTALCMFQYVQINQPLRWYWSSLPHEMAHAIQVCHSTDAEPDHGEWNEKGIYRAVDWTLGELSKTILPEESP